MNIPFTCIPDKLNYPPKYRSVLSQLHSSLISEVFSTYKGHLTFKDRRYIIQVMNSISFSVLNGDTVPKSIPDGGLLNNVRLVDDDECRLLLKGIYLSDKNIDWDVELPDAVSPSTTAYAVTIEPKVQSDISFRIVEDTPKEDLYIQPPFVPKFDVKRIWKRGVVDNTEYCIYESCPQVPTKQNEISVTTDFTRMTHQDLLRLYPHQLIKTRGSAMYSPVDGLEFDRDLGVILPIEGFTKKQLMDNIIKYPHLYKLMKETPTGVSGFYSTIELQGSLYPISEVWKSLPESRVIPFNSSFIKEYVVRRYLLERDELNMKHNYPMYGTLYPFLTLFMPKENYVAKGYTDLIDIATQCVISRVSYKQSRNPIIRRLENV